MLKNSFLHILMKVSILVHATEIHLSTIESWICTLQIILQMCLYVIYVWKLLMLVLSQDLSFRVVSSLLQCCSLSDFILLWKTTESCGADFDDELYHEMWKYSIWITSRTSILRLSCLQSFCLNCDQCSWSIDWITHCTCYSVSLTWFLSHYCSVSKVLLLWSVLLWKQCTDHGGIVIQWSHLRCGPFIFHVCCLSCLFCLRFAERLSWLLVTRLSLTMSEIWGSCSLPFTVQSTVVQPADQQYISFSCVSNSFHQSLLTIFSYPSIIQVHHALQ